MPRTLATASSGCEPVSRISAGCRTDRGVIVTGVWSMDNGHSIRGGLNRNLGLKWGKKNQHAVVLLNTVNKSELEKNIITGDKTG